MSPVISQEDSKRPANDDRNALTCIHGRIHCVAIRDTGDINRHDELDHIDIENFLTTLAAVVVSIARREGWGGHQGSGSR